MKKSYNYLKIWLLAQEKTVKEFAEYTDISRTHLSAIINGRMKPSKHLDFIIWHSYEKIKNEGWGSK
jgi:transcriptional regulator with XRE-family HTH domain